MSVKSKKHKSKPKSKKQKKIRVWQPMIEGEGVTDYESRLPNVDDLGMRLHIHIDDARNKAYLAVQIDSPEEQELFYKSFELPYILAVRLTDHQDRRW